MRSLGGRISRTGRACPHTGRAAPSGPLSHLSLCPPHISPQRTSASSCAIHCQSSLHQVTSHKSLQIDTAYAYAYCRSEPGAQHSNNQQVGEACEEDAMGNFDLNPREKGNGRKLLDSCPKSQPLQSQSSQSLGGACMAWWRTSSTRRGRGSAQA